MHFKKIQAYRKGKPTTLISLTDAAAFVGVTEKDLKTFFDIFEVGYYYPAPNQQAYVEESAARNLKDFLDK